MYVRDATIIRIFKTPHIIETWRSREISSQKGRGLKIYFICYQYMQNWSYMYTELRVVHIYWRKRRIHELSWKSECRSVNKLTWSSSLTSSRCWSRGSLFGLMIKQWSTYARTRLRPRMSSSLNLKIFCAGFQRPIGMQIIRWGWKWWW